MYISVSFADTHFACRISLPNLISLILFDLSEQIMQITVCNYALPCCSNEAANQSDVDMKP